MPSDIRIVIKGAGEMATGVAVRLHRAGFTRIVMLETAQPTAVRRAVSFCEAVYDGAQDVEGIAAQRIAAAEELPALWQNLAVGVAVDPEWRLVSALGPHVVVDAVLAKRNLGTRMDEAPLVVALGPGFVAGVDAHRVVETNRGHDLGRVYSSGSAEANTGIPGNIGGFTVERVLRAPTPGEVRDCLDIGSIVRPGETVCRVGGQPVAAAVAGVLRGCIRPGITVEQGTKIGDVDPRGRRENCFTVSEKARALGGAVLEAVCAVTSAIPLSTPTRPCRNAPSAPDTRRTAR